MFIFLNMDFETGFGILIKLLKLCIRRSLYQTNNYLLFLPTGFLSYMNSVLPYSNLYHTKV